MSVVSTTDHAVISYRSADWTPNTNHLGFYYAKALGLYAKAGLAVKFLSTDDPVYQGSYLPSAAGGADAAKGSPTAPPQPEAYATPCSRVAAGLATFAINSPEGACAQAARSALLGSHCAYIHAHPLQSSGTSVSITT